MKKGDLAKKRGFTMIEIVLVLGIAGLIMMAIFIILPSVQRNERDTERREDMSIPLKAIKDYQSNNRGALPTDWNSFRTKYLGSDFIDPDGTTYTLRPTPCNATVNAGDCQDNSKITMDHIIYIIQGAACDGEKAIRVENPRRIAAVYKLEGGGFYCGNS